MPGALFYERERQNRYGYHPTATMNHHSHPVIGANPGDSALLYVASWSSSKVLMAQTADPLSAVQEHVQPSFRPSLGEIQARLINRTAAGSASTLIRTPTHTLKCRPHQSDPEATVEHSPINPPTTSQPPANHQLATIQLPTSAEPSPMAASALIGPVQVRASTEGGYLSLIRH